MVLTNDIGLKITTKSFGVTTTDMADYLLPEENDPLVAASSINQALTGWLLEVPLGGIT